MTTCGKMAEGMKGLKDQRKFWFSQWRIPSGLPTAQWWRGSVWPSPKNYRRLWWDFRCCCPDRAAQLEQSDLVSKSCMPAYKYSLTTWFSTLIILCLLWKQIQIWCSWYPPLCLHFQSKFWWTFINAKVKFRVKFQPCRTTHRPIDDIQK